MEKQKHQQWCFCFCMWRCWESNPGADKVP